MLKYLFTQIESHITATAASFASIAKTDELATTLKDVFVKKEIIKADEIGGISPGAIINP